LTAIFAVVLFLLQRRHKQRSQGGATGSFSRYFKSTPPSKFPINHFSGGKSQSTRGPFEKYSPYSTHDFASQPSNPSDATNNSYLTNNTYNVTRSIGPEISGGSNPQVGKKPKYTKSATTPDSIAAAFPDNHLTPSQPFRPYQALSKPDPLHANPFLDPSTETDPFMASSEIEEFSQAYNEATSLQSPVSSSAASRGRRMQDFEEYQVYQNYQVQMGRNPLTFSPGTGGSSPEMTKSSPGGVYDARFGSESTGYSLPAAEGPLMSGGIGYDYRLGSDDSTAAAAVPLMSELGDSKFGSGSTLTMGSISSAAVPLMSTAEQISYQPEKVKPMLGASVSSDKSLTGFGGGQWLSQARPSFEQQSRNDLSPIGLRPSPPRNNVGSPTLDRFDYAANVSEGGVSGASASGVSISEADLVVDPSVPRYQLSDDVPRKGIPIVIPRKQLKGKPVINPRKSSE
jgi:hypothetical protein